MGTDIHLYVERRENGAWVSCDTWEPDQYEDDPKPLTVPFGKHFYDTRSYDTFAILADVRNGSGFAGVDTGDGFVPISEPRGLPPGLSPELSVEVERFLEHTPSWLTVAEIMAYDWTRTTNKRGIVRPLEYFNWSCWRKGQGLGSEEWSGGVWGAEVRYISEKEMADFVNHCHEEAGNLFQETRARLENERSILCRISWQTPYYRAASIFLSECLPRLWRLGRPEDVRIVFWFDS